MASKRRKFSREFKLNVVQAFQSHVPVPELIRQFDIHPNMVYKWVQEYRVNPTGAFRGGVDDLTPPAATEARVGELERMVGRLTMENDFLKKVLQQLEHRQQASTAPTPGAN